MYYFEISQRISGILQIPISKGMALYSLVTFVFNYVWYSATED